MSHADTFILANKVCGDNNGLSASPVSKWEQKKQQQTTSKKLKWLKS